ncbi:MAG: amino acid adenylation domain-containing protein, partial [Bacteroidales bacterium]|nr:amino acid adenylation domain-containing protein [Bacteroidales bacterium]
SIERDISRNPVFDVMFSFQNQIDSRADLSGMERDQYVHRSGLSKFDLTLSAVDYGEQIMLSFEYCTKLFKAETIERFINYFREIIRQLPERIDEKLSTLDLLSTEEKNLLLHEFNNTRSDYPKEKSICQLLEEQAGITPDNIAVVKDDISLSYIELNIKVNQLSNGLLAKGFNLGNKIGVFIDRSIESIITILGVLKSGCVYLPIEKDSPQERLNYIINDSDLDCILDPTSVKNNKLEFNISIFSYQEMLSNNDNKLLRNIDNESPAYIIYTSGTTGNPKGVLVGHQSLTNLITSQIFYYQLNTTDRVLQFSTLTFDASLEQIGISLLSGSQLVLIEKEKLLDIDEFYNYIQKNNITHLDVVPAFLTELKPEECESLKRLVVGGEVCGKVLAEKWRTKLPFYNAYGPTETTVTSIELKIENDSKELDKISIGKPLANTEIYILDKFNNLQLTGVSGELCISGDGLSFGYINNPELTNKKFIDHPFKKGKRLYRTGDLAHWLPDGNIEFLGRIDHQVKIRGFRIELGEIENALHKHQNIKDSVVIDIEENGEKYLCAYLVIKEAYNEEEIRSYLSASLPDYMIPSYFVELEKIPLNSNGKVNRKALPLPEVKAGDSYVAPSNETEEKLVEIWSEVLNIEKEEISVTANFFAIGGHSLKAATCINKLMNKFDINIPLLEIFKNPTILQLAEIIYINTSKKRINDDQLVLLREGDINGGNIFLIHDGSGDVDAYIEFCKQANDGINYWGIRAGKLKKYLPINITIEQLATRYIKCLRKIQKQGEYNIAAWSLGGTIAFEMIRQLEQEQEKVRFFGIIDSKPPNLNEEVKIKEFSVQSELDWMRNYIKDEGIIAELSLKKDLEEFWIDMLGYLKNLNNAEGIIKDEIIRNIGFEIKDYKDISIEELLKFMNFARSLSAACYNYTPKNIINTQINYFAASDSKQIITKNWQEYSKKDLIFKEVQGNHFTIFKQPNVEQLYKKFKMCFITIDKKV